MSLSITVLRIWPEASCHTSAFSIVCHVFVLKKTALKHDHSRIASVQLLAPVNTFTVDQTQSAWRIGFGSSVRTSSPHPRALKGMDKPASLPVALIPRQVRTLPRRKHLTFSGAFVWRKGKGSVGG